MIHTRIFTTGIFIKNVNMWNWIHISVSHVYSVNRDKVFKILTETLFSLSFSLSHSVCQIGGYFSKVKSIASVEFLFSNCSMYLNIYTIDLECFISLLYHIEKLFMSRSLYYLIHHSMNGRWYGKNVGIFWEMV